MSEKTEAATRPTIGLSAAAMLLPATLLVIVSLVIPTFMLVRYSFNKFDPVNLMIESLTLENYLLFFTDSYFQEVIATTFAIAAISTIASAILGFPVAYYLARTQSRFKSLMIIVLIFPLLVGNVVRATGWMALLGTGGIVDKLLQVTSITSSSISLMYTPFAVLIGTVSVVLPFMILTLQSVLEGIDYSYRDAACNLGASPSTAFRRIILPLSLPGLAAGSVIVFILCMNAYATPVLLGGPSFKMMAPALYQQITVASNWPFGSALAVILMIVTIAATVTATIFLSRRTR